MTLARWMTPGRLIAAVVFLLPLLAVYGPVQIAALQALAGLGAVLFCLRHRPRPGPRLLTAAALLVALVLWAATSALWSIDPGESLFESIRMGLGAVGELALIALAHNLDTAEREWVGTSLLAGFCLGLGLLAVEIATQGGLRHFLQDHLQAERSPFIYSVASNRSAGVLALLVWPAALVLWNRGLPILAVLALAATTGLISLLENTGAAGRVGRRPGPAGSGLAAPGRNRADGGGDRRPGRADRAPAIGDPAGTDPHRRGLSLNSHARFPPPEHLAVHDGTDRRTPAARLGHGQRANHPGRQRDGPPHIAERRRGARFGNGAHAPASAQCFTPMVA